MQHHINSNHKILLLAIIFVILIQINPSQTLPSDLSYQNTHQLNPQSQTWMDDPLPTYFQSVFAKLNFVCDGDSVKWNMHFDDEGTTEVLAGSGNYSHLYDIQLLKAANIYNFSFARGEYYSSAAPYSGYNHHNFTFANAMPTTIMPDLWSLGISFNNIYVTGQTDGFLVPDKSTYIKYANGLGAGPYAGINISFTGTYVIDPSSLIFNLRDLTNGSSILINSTKYEHQTFWCSYSLDTTLVLNSTYYSKDNCKIYYFTDGQDYDQYTKYLRWVESTDTIFKLKSPWYKLRITDLQNNILYEDASFQEYSRFRYLDLLSMRVQNNAPEPINAELITNPGHYQGALSFDTETNNIPPANGQKLYTINTMPPVSQSLNGHSKILNFSIFYGQDCMNDIRFTTPYYTSLEYWIYPKSSPGSAGGWHAVQYTSLGTSFFTNLWALFCINYDFSVSSGIILDNWNHIRFSTNTNGTGTGIYINNIYLGSYPTNLYNNYVNFISYSNNPQYYIDAIDYSSSPGYYINRNMALNNTEAIYDIIRNQNYNHTGHYQGAESFDYNAINTQPSGYTFLTYENSTIYLANEYQGHKKILNLTDTSNGGYSDFRKTFTAVAAGSLEFWINISPLDNILFFSLSGVGTTAFQFWFRHSSGFMCTDDGVMIWSTNPSFNTWHHIRITWDGSMGPKGQYDLFIDGVIVADDYDYSAPLVSLDFFRGYSWNLNRGGFLLDALDYSWSPGYFINRNTLENQSTSLETWNVYPAWNTGYYQENYLMNQPSSYTISQPTALTSYQGRNNVLNFTNPTWTRRQYTFPTYTDSMILEYWLYSTYANFGILTFGDWASPAITYNFQYGTLQFEVQNGSSNLYSIDWGINCWNHFRYNLVKNGPCQLYVNGVLKSTTWAQNVNIDRVNFQNYAMIIDALDYSTSSGYFSFRNTRENTTASMLAMNYTASPLLTPNLTLLVNPYSYSLSNFTSSNYLYRISDLYNNSLYFDGILSNESEIVFTPANVRENFISLADQQNQYLDWENYKLYVNGTQIYANRFYREIDAHVNISIYSRFGTYLNSTIHIVTRDDNWIPINLTRYCLKIYNQQSAFMHYNITLDPNYYPTASVFWSEWLAPNEVGKNYLYPDNYKITLMHNETGTPTYVSYNLPFNTDDVKLISSSNTLFAVMQNINNLNTTVSTQFNYVSLNFTNTNSRIGNITNIITISFGGENITLENFLLEQMNYFSFITSNLSNVFQYINNSMFAQNTTMDSLYLMSDNTYTFINDTLDIIVMQNNDEYNYINSTIGSIAELSLNSFLYLNSSINNSITWMAQNFTLIGDDINSNQLEILTQYSILASNITNNSLDIINNLYLVNNSISNLTADLTNNVLLMNNTIYTAMVNISQNLAIDSNLILGNLSITFQQNEFLTELFKKTMFSDLLFDGLNWSAIGYNYTQVENYIKNYPILNQYRNESVELLLRYQNQIQSMSLAALESATQFLPNTNVDYRVKSMATGEYLTEWEAVTGENITIGWYNETISATPAEIRLEIKDYLLVALFGVVGFSAMAVLYIKTKAQLDANPDSAHKTKKQKLIPGVRDTSTFSGMDTQIFRSKKSKNSNSLLIVGAIIVIVFIIVYLLIRFGV